MVAETFVRTLIGAETFLATVVIMIDFLSRPVVAFDAEVVVSVHGEFREAITGFQRPWASVMLAGTPERYISLTATGAYFCIYFSCGVSPGPAAEISNVTDISAAVVIRKILCFIRTNFQNNMPIYGKISDFEHISVVGSVCLRENRPAFRFIFGSITASGGVVRYHELLRTGIQCALGSLFRGGMETLRRLVLILIQICSLVIQQVYAFHPFRQFREGCCVAAICVTAWYIREIGCFFILYEQRFVCSGMFYEAVKESGPVIRTAGRRMSSPLFKAPISVFVKSYLSSASLRMFSCGSFSLIMYP